MKAKKAYTTYTLHVSMFETIATSQSLAELRVFAKRMGCDWFIKNDKGGVVERSQRD